MTRISHSFWLGGVILLSSVPLWSQQQPQDSSSASAPAANAPLFSAPQNSDDPGRMMTPPPVSGQIYPLSFASEERSNYLRGGVTFNTAYSDNVLGATSPTPVSDVSYSVWPTIALDETTSRLHTVFTYSPGFTFYQNTSSRNDADQNFGADFQYRLSPHVTLSLRDSLRKSSNVFNQPDL